MLQSDIVRRFAFHPADQQTGERHQRAREACQRAAEEINGLLDDSREKSLAITALEEAMMWTNAGIARGN